MSISVSKNIINLLTPTIAVVMTNGLVGAASAQETGIVSEMPEEITVTGSRISRSGMNTPVPLTTMNVAEMDALAPGQLIDSLSQMPQFFNNNRPDDSGRFNGGAAGQSFLNMRGLGTNRTLVLLNGRRIVPSSRLSATDISLFPEALVRTIEVVTGGASAAYGTDAVSGVTNFIIDTDFTGFDGKFQAGATQHGEMSSQEMSLSFGADLGSKAHILTSIDINQNDSLYGWDKRDWFQDWAIINNPDPNGPERITVPNVRSTQYTSGGLITGGPLSGTQFLADGTPAPFNPGSIVTNTAQSGGDGINPRRQNPLYPELKRGNAFAYLDYNLTDDSTVFLQGIYARNQTIYEVSELRQYVPYAPATIYADNAFLHDSVRKAMQENSLESFPFGRHSSFADWADQEWTENVTFSVTTGFEQNFRNGWQLNGYYQFGKNKRENRAFQARLDRAFRAMDSVVNTSTGAIVCRSTLSNPGDGCVPANFFGKGQMSQEAKEYILSTKIGEAIIEQHSAEITANGELHQGWGSGPILAAAGISYRKDTLDMDMKPEEYKVGKIVPDYELGYKGLPKNLYGADLFQHATMIDIAGGFSVKEVFAETIVPIVSNQNYADSVVASLSARYADYSGSGGVLAWKSGIDWTVNDSIRLRATRSRDTRAANLGERFDESWTGASIDDPFIGVNGVPPAEGIIQGGNPSVSPELSDTLTYGIVYQPKWLPDFSLSIDRYVVEIEDAIASVGAQNIVDQCFLNGAFCDLLNQDPVTGEVLRVDDVPVNLEQATAKGVDIEVSYSMPFLYGQNIDIRFLASYLEENSLTGQDNSTIERAGEGTLPEWTATATALYNNGPLSASLSARYIGSAKIDLDWTEGIDMDDNTIESAYYVNARVGYEINFSQGILEVYGNIQNLFDRDPSLAPSIFSGFTGAGHTNGLFDKIGRRYTFGMNYSF